MPLSTLQATSRDATCKTEGQDGVAVSFPVGLFHSLQHAGLTRRSLINLAVLDNLNRWRRMFTDNKRLSMSFLHFTTRTALLLLPLFSAGPLLAQWKPPDACGQLPNGAKEAIRRLPENARYWLAEDAVYISSPDERCAFLLLDTDEEREQFMEQFWYRRAGDEISVDYHFKTEFYRRIVFANENYGSKTLAGRKTDRGRLYVISGAPDYVERTSEGSTGETAARPVETWHYHYIKGIGENVEIHFDYNGRYDDYVLRDADRYLVVQADPGPEQFPVTLENVGRLHAVYGPPKIRFKDLEAILVSEVARDQVKIVHRIEFSAATRATTLARISVEIPCENCTRDGQIPPSSAYPVFIQVSQRSGRVVATSELTAENAVREVGYSKFVLDARVDIPL